MSDLKRIGLVWLKWLAIAGACLALAAWLTACGSLTVKYDSTGKHPEKRTD